MSRETRFDKLESDIVDALRRAPGAAPSADLDARILARAHAAVAKPAKRPQPIWFSMAAGLVVLVGSGLALRIWHQVEHAPSALDAPVPAASAPTAGADDGAAAAGSAAADAIMEQSSERASPKREQAAPSAPLEQRLPTEPEAQLRRENTAAESRLDGLSDLSATAPVADAVMPAAAPAPRPFPAEPAQVTATEKQVPMATGSAASLEMVAPAAPPPPMPSPAAAKVGAAQAEAAAAADSARSRAAAGSAAAPAAGRDFPEPAKPALDERSERQADAPIELQSADAFTTGVAAIREAVARGDRSTARTLAIALQRDYPARELPDDVQALVDAPQ